MNANGQGSLTWAQMPNGSDCHPMGNDCSPEPSISMRNDRPSDLTRIENRDGGGSVVERRTPEREVEGSKPTSAVLCP